jgi:adhesin/invasin
LGNPVANQNVNLAAGGSNNVWGAALGVTSGSGQWTTTLASTTAELKHLTATASALTLSGNALFVAGAPNSGPSSIVATPNSTVADNTSVMVLTVQLLDAFDNPVNGQSVSLAALPPGYGLGASGGTTDAQGRWQTTLTATQAGAVNLTAVAASASVTTTATFVPGAPTNQSISLTASPSNTVADSGTQILLTLTINDPFGNPISGQNANFTSSIPGDIFANANGVSGADGTLTADLVATQAGTHPLFASFNGLQASTPLIIQAASPNATQSQMTASPTTVVADNSALMTLSATFKDAYGNPIVGGTVTWGGVGAFEILSPPTSVTSGSGTATSTV